MRIGLQTASVYAGVKGFLDNLAVSAVLPFETALHQYLSDEKQDVIDRLETATKFDADLEGALRGAITEFKAQYVKDNANALAA
jgi:F-type H+-transporting ATPase subunit alpha